MGLDMYAHKVKVAPERPVDFEKPENDEEFHYWRKHPNLHGWMERLYREKGGSNEDFNVAPVVLTSEDIDNLEKAVNGDELPETSGFFFGASTPEDKRDDLEFIKKAREVMAEGYTVFYFAWW